MESYGLTVLFSCALTLTARMATAQDAGVCNADSVLLCYWERRALILRPELMPQPDGTDNNTAYDLICSELTETSPCKQAIDHCPQSFKDQFKRSEEGYSKIRSIVCDKDDFKGLQIALRCVDSEKVQRCRAGNRPEREEPRYDTKSALCRSAISEWVCNEDAFPPDCPIGMYRVKVLFSTARQAVTLLLGCGIDTLASSLLPLKEFGVCNAQYGFLCYGLHSTAMLPLQLYQQPHGSHYQTAYDTFCSEVTETSRCKQAIEHCPQSFKDQFKPCEEGYSKIRSIVCNKDHYKDLQRAMGCVDSDKFHRCNARHSTEQLYTRHYDKSVFCRSYGNQWMCKEDAIQSKCPIPINRAKSLFSTLAKASTLLQGCDIETSAAPPLAPQRFFLGFVTLSMLRWIHSSL